MSTIKIERFEPQSLDQFYERLSVGGKPGGVKRAGGKLKLTVPVGQVSGFRVGESGPVMRCKMGGQEVEVLLNRFDVKIQVGETVTVELGERAAQQGDALRNAFEERAMRAVRENLSKLGTRALAEAVAAPTDWGAMVMAMSQAAESAAVEMDPLSEARLRGAEARRRLLEAHGGVLSAEETAKALGMTRQGVDKRRREGKLLAVQFGKRGWRYPAWQFTEDGVVEGLEGVLGALKPWDGWTRIGFFVTENPALDEKTPLEALKAGEVKAVERAAAIYGEQGAA